MSILLDGKIPHHKDEDDDTSCKKIHLDSDFKLLTDDSINIIGTEPPVEYMFINLRWDIHHCDHTADLVD